MTRPLRALALGLALAASGCNSTDGTYLMTVTLQSDDCSPDSAQIGTQFQTLSSLYHTTDGIAVDLSGSLLVGDKPNSGNFDVSLEQGQSMTVEGCDLYSSDQRIEMIASFTADLGYDGTVKSSSTVSQTNCPDTSIESCTLTYSVNAMQLNAASDRRPTGQVNWGYFQGGGY